MNKIYTILILAIALCGNALAAAEGIKPNANTRFSTSPTPIGLGNAPNSKININCYPNPFRESTTFSYQIETNQEKVLLKIYNTIGQEVKTLVNKIQSAGYYAEEWDGKNNQGIELPAGFYFYRLSIGSTTVTKQVLMVR